MPTNMFQLSCNNQHSPMQRQEGKFIGSTKLIFFPRNLSHKMKLSKKCYILQICLMSLWNLPLKKMGTF